MSKPLGSWNRPRDDEPHSPAGVEQIRIEVKRGLMRKYVGIAESMWRWDGMDSDPKFSDAMLMSRDTVPEIYLFRNGECAAFEWHGSIHFLPIVATPGINIYGRATGWQPVPVGWSDRPDGEYGDVTAIRNLMLDSSNSVLLRNDLFSGPDWPYIDSLVTELVDNTLTLNQLQLLAKSPYVFNVSQDNLLTAKNFYLALSKSQPVIYTNRLGDDVTPVVESTQSTIDPALFDLYDRFECQILEFLGFPCVPISKRAQQSVSEVQSNDAKIYVRRLEKLKQREQAADRINRMFGTSLKVVSVIDELEEQADVNENGNYNDTGGDSDA